MSVLAKAAQAIEVLGSAETPTRLSTISEALDLPKSSAHRILNELVELGLVNKCPDGGYAIGHRLIRWGNYAESYIGLRSLATPILRRLRDETNMTVLLAVRSGTMRTVVATEPGRGLRPVTVPIGNQVRLGQGASGRVLFAFAPESVQEEALQALTDDERAASVTREQAATVRERGWSASFGEMEPDLAGMSVPIMSGQECIGALVLAGSAVSLTEDVMVKLLKPMHQAANQIANESMGVQL